MERAAAMNDTMSFTTWVLMFWKPHKDQYINVYQKKDHW
jgi:hypothetical protein